MPRTSYPALYAAHTLFKQYDFVVRPDDGHSHRFPRLQATEVHAAIFIDHKTNVHLIANLRPEIAYWQDVMKLGVNDNHTARQIATFVRKTLDTIDKIPHFSEEEQRDDPQTVTTTALTISGAYVVKMGLSKASLDAMETLFYYYEIGPPARAGNEFSRAREMELRRRTVARLIESCLQIGKVVKALPSLRNLDMGLRKGTSSIDDVVRVLTRLGLLFEFLPSYDYHAGTLDRDEVKMLS